MVGEHAKGKNSDSIGACLVGDFRLCEPSVEQLTSAIRLVHELSHTVGWEHPLSQEFHRAQWLPNACPGKMLDREDFREIVMRGYT